MLKPTALALTTICLSVYPATAGSVNGPFSFKCVNGTRFSATFVDTSDGQDAPTARELSARIHIEGSSKPIDLPSEWGEDQSQKGMLYSNERYSLYVGHGTVRLEDRTRRAKTTCEEAREE